MVRSQVALALLAILLLAGCAGNAPPKDSPGAAAVPTWTPLGTALAAPLANGPLPWTTEDYELGNMTVGGAAAGHEGYEYESLIRGTITMPEGPGPFPLAVFLHGQHTTCTNGDCSVPYRNDQGYVYLMEHLASHGIATASILAHEINNQNGQPDIGMWARGELALGTIDALQGSQYASRLDFTHVGLMGHSRGGEGVVTAAEVNLGRAQPHDLAAIIALAPTDFAYRNVANIPFLTLAPYCDGDVYNLHGLRQFDQSRYVDQDAVKVQVLVMGANHNNYNTMWGQGVGAPLDSAGDDAGFGSHLYPECDMSREDGGGRLSLEETYAESILHLGGFLRWTLLGDDSVAPYFLGAAQPPEACPGATECPDAVHLSTMTPGRRDLFHVEQNGFVAAPGVGVGIAPAASPCRMGTCSGNVYSSAWMANVQILRATPSPVLTLMFNAPTDLRETPVLNIRVGVPTDGGINSFGPPAMTVSFTDAAGTVVAVPVNDPGLFMPPGLLLDAGAGNIASAKVAANSVAIRLPEGLDAGNITAITATFTAAGPMGALPDRILVADAWLNRDTASAFAPGLA